MRAFELTRYAASLPDANLIKNAWTLVPGYLGAKILEKVTNSPVATFVILGYFVSTMDYHDKNIPTYCRTVDFPDAILSAILA